MLAHLKSLLVGIIFVSLIGNVKAGFLDSYLGWHCFGSYWQEQNGQVTKGEERFDASPVTAEFNNAFPPFWANRAEFRCIPPAGSSSEEIQYKGDISGGAGFTDGRYTQAGHLLQIHPKSGGLELRWCEPSCRNIGVVSKRDIDLVGFDNFQNLTIETFDGPFGLITVSRLSGGGTIQVDFDQPEATGGLKHYVIAIPWS